MRRRAGGRRRVQGSCGGGPGRGLLLLLQGPPLQPAPACPLAPAPHRPARPTMETLAAMAKVCRVEGEAAKVSVRHARKAAMDAAKRLGSEDERKRAEREVQKLTDAYIEQVGRWLLLVVVGWCGRRVWPQPAAEERERAASWAAGRPLLPPATPPAPAAVAPRWRTWWPARRSRSRCTTRSAAAGLPAACCGCGAAQLLRLQPAHRRGHW